jgi:hypothetical protein
MISVQYDDYSIEPYEIRRGTWRSRLRRRDGQMIKAAPYGRRFPFIPVEFDSASPQGAVEIAKVFVDRSVALGAMR